MQRKKDKSQEVLIIRVSCIFTYPIFEINFSTEGATLVVIGNIISSELHTSARIIEEKIDLILWESLKYDSESKKENMS